MLLRNLDPRRGLCNGTRLICKELHDRLIDAEIITVIFFGNRVLIQRIDFIFPSSLGLPFEMKRRQFPVKLAFGMTRHKDKLLESWDCIWNLLYLAMDNYMWLCCGSDLPLL